MNKLRPSAQPAPAQVVPPSEQSRWQPPAPTSAGARLVDHLAMGQHFTEDERALVAKAIQFTRVSYFTKEQRELLDKLMRRVTGYRVKGGI